MGTRRNMSAVVRVSCLRSRLQCSSTFHEVHSFTRVSFLRPQLVTPTHLRLSHLIFYLLPVHPPPPHVQCISAPHLVSSSPRPALTASLDAIFMSSHSSLVPTQ